MGFASAISGSAIGCFGKVAYTNPALAEKVAKRMRRTKERGLVAYRCQVCSRWHIGEQDRWRKRVVLGK